MRWSSRIFPFVDQQDQNYTVAAIAMVTAMLGLVINDVINKLSREAGIVTSQLLSVRGVIASLMLLALIFIMKRQHELKNLLRPAILLRSVLEAPIALSFIWSLKYLNLAEITAILMLAPFMIAGLGSLIFQERIGLRRLTAICLGFIGFMLIEPPWSIENGFKLGLPVMVALGCALWLSVRELVTSRMDTSYPPLIATLGTTIIATLAGFCLAPFEDWPPLPPLQITYLTASALVVTGANYLIFIGSRIKDVSAIAPYRFTSIVWAALFGFIFLNEIPNLQATIGIVIIVSANVYIYFRERHLRKKELI